MCATCGCSDGAGALVALHDHVHEPGHDHDHAHAHDGHTHALTTHDARTIVLERAVLAKNDEFAERNRRWFAERAILALNLVSSPGSGKTTLLERTIRDLGGTLPMAVIEGDQATENDSRRVRAAGARAVQVNTGTGCHLEADMIRRALELLAPAQRSVVMIENVGNLVCPALFDLGERAKVAILSVTEGDDKPAKYPHMFAAADLLVINKTDLLPYVDFDIDRCIGHARAVRPNLDAIAVSATSGDNLDAWYAWILKARRAR
jgi:hydrogenase nickel incorporation protein HypB